MQENKEEEEDLVHKEMIYAIIAKNPDTGQMNAPKVQDVEIMEEEDMEGEKEDIDEEDTQVTQDPVEVIANTATKRGEDIEVEVGV